MVNSITFLLLWFIGLNQSLHLLHHKLVQGWAGLNQLSQHVTRRRLLVVSGKEKQVLVSYVIYEQKSMWFQLLLAIILWLWGKQVFGWNQYCTWKNERVERNEPLVTSVGHWVNQTWSLSYLWTSWNNRQIFFLSQFDVQSLKTYIHL